MSDSVWPHRQQPARLPHPGDSPGKNTGVGCHFLLQCIKVKSQSEVAQSCLTLRDPMDCSPPGSSAHGIFQARVLEWGAIAFSWTLLISLCGFTMQQLCFSFSCKVSCREISWIKSDPKRPQITLPVTLKMTVYRLRLNLKLFCWSTAFFCSS